MAGRKQKKKRYYDKNGIVRWGERLPDFYVGNSSSWEFKYNQQLKKLRRLNK